MLKVVHTSFVLFFKRNFMQSNSEDVWNSLWSCCTLKYLLLVMSTLVIVNVLHSWRRWCVLLPCKCKLVGWLFTPCWAAWSWPCRNCRVESFRNGRTDSAAEDPPAASLFGKPAADRERAKTKSPTSYLGRIIFDGTACLFLPANKFWPSFRVGLFVWCGSE